MEWKSMEIERLQDQNRRMLELQGEQARAMMALETEIERLRALLRDVNEITSSECRGFAGVKSRITAALEGK